MAFILHSNVVVGGVAFCFMVGNYALLETAPSLPLLILATCGTMLVYLMDRVWMASPEDGINRPERLAYVEGHRGLLLTETLLVAGGGIAASFHLRPATLLVGAGLGLLGLLYTVPVFPGGRRVKSVPILKPLVIGLAWAVGGVWLPVIEAGGTLDGWVLLLTGYRLLFIFPNLLMADIPDRQGDRVFGVENIARAHMLEPMLQAARFGLLLAGGGMLAWVGLAGGPWLVGVDVVGLVLMFLLLRNPLNRPSWFYGLVIDAVVAWPLVTALVARFTG